MISSRDALLAAVRAARQPGEVPPPLPPVPVFEGDATAARFTAVLRSIGGEVAELVDLRELPAALARHYPAARAIASPLLPAPTVAITAAATVEALAAVDLAVLRGEFGVAENGSVWLPEANMLHRALPTSAEHLVLVLDCRQLVGTMHQAYQRLAGGPGGYGLFLAGPSKTADIEQSLVIGAAKARSLLVLLHPGLSGGL